MILVKPFLIAYCRELTAVVFLVRKPNLKLVLESLVEVCQSFMIKFGCILIRFYIDFTTGNCEFGAVRLATQSSSHEGLLQICLFGEWVTVCSNGFDGTDAEVACSALGFEGNGGTVIIHYLNSSVHFFLSHNSQQ